MIKTTEDLKREMHETLNAFRMYAVTVETLEQAFEAYLGRLSNEAECAAARLAETAKYSGILSDAYSHQQSLTHAVCVAERESWNQIYDLKGQVRELLAANDNGCRALIDLQNTSRIAGDQIRESNRLLAEARDTVKRHRQSIGQLKNDRNNAQANERRLKAELQKVRKYLSELRKELPGTSAQSSGLSIHKSICGGMAIGSHTDCVHPFQNVRWATRENGANYYKCGLCGEQAK